MTRKATPETEPPSRSAPPKASCRTGKDQPEAETSSPGRVPAGLTHNELLFMAAYEAALEATQGGFPYLSAEQIAHPPKKWMDAALARQVAVTLAQDLGGYSQRELSETMGRNREGIIRARRIINERCNDRAFNEFYDVIRADAERNFADRLEENGIKKR